MANKFMLFSGFLSDGFDTLEEAKAEVDKRLNSNPQAEITIFQNMGTYTASVQISELGTSSTDAADSKSNK